MIDLQKCRQIAPELSDISDEDLQKILDSLYELGNLAFDVWIDKNKSSKYPHRSNGLIKEDK
ncbi:MAG: hypothetical protein WCO84_00315 [bacterium]